MLSDILIDSLPRYETKIPSSNKSVTFRPFLVRDEKTLLISSETSEKKDLIVTLSNLVENCFDGIEDINDLYMSDLEYLLIELRSKSIGDIIDFAVVTENSNEVDITLNLSSDIQIQGDYKDTTIDLGKNVACKFRHPRVKDFISDDLNESNPDDFMKIMAKCLVEITNKDETINTELFSQQEKIEFLESMNKKQFESVIEHFANTPKLTATKVYEEDGKERQIRFEGVKDFFV